MTFFPVGFMTGISSGEWLLK